jgi:hypothetical protein
MIRLKRSLLVRGLRVAVDFMLPMAVYYGLRLGGASIYWSLLAGAIVSAATSVVPMVRHRRMDGLSVYMTSMMVGSVVVSLIAGGTRFLLARDALLTAVTGLWLIGSVWARRPLAYLFSKPLLEGRFHWPKSFDDLWDRSPAFRHMWRVSSVLYGIGCLADAVLRVVMAYTLKPDLVPALSTGFYLSTSAVLIVITNIYYVAAGIHNKESAIYRTVEPDVVTAR